MQLSTLNSNKLWTALSQYLAQHGFVFGNVAFRYLKFCIFLESDNIKFYQESVMFAIFAANILNFLLLVVKY